MMSRILDGTAVSKAIRAEVTDGVASLATPGDRAGPRGHPGRRRSRQLGLRRGQRSGGARSRNRGKTLRFPADPSEADLLATVESLNRDDAVDAILVQLPLPRHIDATRILGAIDPAKDADGFHPVNAGRSSCRGSPHRCPARRPEFSAARSRGRTPPRDAGRRRRQERHRGKADGVFSCPGATPP